MLNWKSGLAVGACLVTGLCINQGQAIAAERVVLTYGFLSMDIPIEDLTTFAETGEPSDELARLFDLAGQEPETFRSTLNEPVELSPTVVDFALNTTPGEWMLDRVSESIHPASGQGGRLALRSALIGAAADDNEITLLEVMETYPTPEIVVRGDRLLETYNRIYDVLKPLEDLAEVLRTIEY
jgi:hypothetical protein